MLLRPPGFKRIVTASWAASAFYGAGGLLHVAQRA